MVSLNSSLSFCFSFWLSPHLTAQVVSDNVLLMFTPEYQPPAKITDLQVTSIASSEVF